MLSISLKNCVCPRTERFSDGALINFSKPPARLPFKNYDIIRCIHPALYLAAGRLNPGAFAAARALSFPDKSIQGNNLWKKAPRTELHFASLARTGVTNLQRARPRKQRRQTDTKATRCPAGVEEKKRHHKGCEFQSFCLTNELTLILVCFFTTLNLFQGISGSVSSDFDF